MSDTNEQASEPATATATAEVLNPETDKLRVKAMLQEQLASAKKQASEFEADALNTILNEIKNPEFIASIARIQEAAEDLISPGVKLNVLYLLRGYSGLEKLAAARNQ